jgi:hypothetical protein
MMEGNVADPATMAGMGLGHLGQAVGATPPPPPGGFMDGIQQATAGVPQQAMGVVPGALGMVASVQPMAPSGPQPMTYEEFVRQMMGGR